MQVLLVDLISRQALVGATWRKRAGGALAALVVGNADMDSERRRELIAFRLTISGPDLQNNVEYFHRGGPLRIGSGYDNGILLDHDGMAENHFFVEARSDGVMLCPLGGYLATAEGRKIDEWTKVRYGDSFSIGSTKYVVTIHRNGRSLIGIWELLLYHFRGKGAVSGAGAAHLMSSLRDLLFKGRYAVPITISAVAASAMIIVLILPSWPVTSPDGNSALLKVANSQRIKDFELESGALTMTGWEVDGRFFFEARFATDRDVVKAQNLTKKQFPNSSTNFLSDETIMRSTRVTLSAFASEVEVTKVMEGVATLHGHSRSREELTQIEDMLTADVPALAGVTTVGVRLPNSQVKLDRTMLPDAIAGVWAGSDPYIELDNGVRYWIGSVLEDGAEIISIELDRITVTKKGSDQRLEIIVDGAPAGRPSIADIGAGKLLKRHDAHAFNGNEDQVDQSGKGMAKTVTVREHVDSEVALPEDNAVIPSLRTEDTAHTQIPKNYDVELSCLAENIYFEARNEPEKGRRAVAHVVMNRVASPRFPTSVCDVVRQGGSDPLFKCQFTWWCDGISDDIKNAEAWQDAIGLARRVYWGHSKDMTNGALFYHADYVTPYWRKAFDKGPQIGRHIFYTYKQQAMNARPSQQSVVIPVD